LAKKTSAFCLKQCTITIKYRAEIVSQSDYTIIASAIQKNAFIEKFGKLQDDVYEVALSFVIEQAVLILSHTDGDPELAIIIERRGQKEDKQLDDLVAYPIARHVIEPERANPAFEFWSPRFIE